MHNPTLNMLFKLAKKKKKLWKYIIVGLRAQITRWALDLDQELSSPRTSEW